MVMTHPPFAHTPYDGSSHPFTVGLAPIGDEDWLEPDGLLIAHLLRKDELLRASRQAVLRAEPDTMDAQNEVLDLVLGNLQACHGDKYKVHEGAVEIAGRQTVPLDRACPIETAARLVQEDLVLMRPGPEGYRLVAACLCFPSSWSLAEKFGQSMPAIHEKVPGFNGARMGNVVARLFENLKVGQLVCRYNWSIYDDDNLHHPEPKQIAPQISAGDERLLAGLFLRVERQTLKRLPVSGDILFTIKIHHDPLAALERHPNRAVIAHGLRKQLLALEAEQLMYKGLTRHQSVLAATLERMSAEAC